MLNNGEGASRYKTLTNSPALLWHNLQCFGELIGGDRVPLPGFPPFSPPPTHNPHMGSAQTMCRVARGGSPEEAAGWGSLWPAPVPVSCSQPWEPLPSPGSSSCPICFLTHHQALPSPKQSLTAAKSCGCLSLQSPSEPPEHCWPHRGGDGESEGGQYFVFPITTADWAKAGGQESPGHRCPASCAALPPRVAADHRFKGKKTCFDSSHVPSAALPGRGGLLGRLAALFGGCKLGVRTRGGSSATCWGAGLCSHPLCSPCCLSAGAQQGFGHPQQLRALSASG